VHRGVLHSGEEVAVKVQHRWIRDVIANDFVNLSVILSWIKYLNPDFDFVAIVEEWSREVSRPVWLFPGFLDLSHAFVSAQALKEVDFIRETANMLRVEKNMKAAKLDVIIAPIFPELCTSKLIVMKFIRAIKVFCSVVLFCFVPLFQYCSPF
jgi:predicted unusual protein kinase regulating ubiquinone biosynthesis (AarF/ABC1/UbiB family)